MLALVYFAISCLSAPCPELRDIKAIRHKLNHGSHVYGYCTYDEYRCIWARLLGLYPAYFEKTTYGLSIESRPMDVYFLTDFSSKLTKERAFMTSLIHGNEAQSGFVLMNFVLDVIEGYTNRVPEFIYMMQRRTVALMPLVNPDGYVKSCAVHQRKFNNTIKLHLLRQSRNIGPQLNFLPIVIPPNLWSTTIDEYKKDLSNYLSGLFAGLYTNAGRTNARRVNLEQDFGLWSHGNREAFSEPETKAMRRFVKEQVALRTAIHFSAGKKHSSNMVMVPRVDKSRQPLIHAMYDDALKVASRVTPRCFAYGGINSFSGCHYIPPWLLPVFNQHKAPSSVHTWLHSFRILSLGLSVKRVVLEDTQLRNEDAKQWVPLATYMVMKAGCQPRIEIDIVPPSIFNDGMSACDTLWLATQEMELQFVNLLELPIDGIASGGRVTPNVGQVNNATTVCVKETHSSVCFCSFPKPGGGKWVNETFWPCSELIRKTEQLCEAANTIIFNEIKFTGKINIGTNDGLLYGDVDTYCTFSVDGVEKNRTSRIEDNASPVWDEEISVGVDDPDKEILIQCWDHDIGNDAFIGETSVQPGLMSRDGILRRKIYNFGAPTYTYDGANFHFDVQCVTNEPVLRLRINQRLQEVVRGPEPAGEQASKGLAP